MTKKQKKVLLRIIAATILILIFRFMPFTGILRFVLYMLPYAIAGYDILIKAAKGILNGQPFDENFLMAVATIGAILLGDYTEGVAVMLFYQLGELFQSIAIGKSRSSISQLMDIRPDCANIEQEDGSLTEVDPDEVEVGTTIVVRPGEKIAIDGIVIEGSSSLNTSALTGESLPRDVSVGDDVISGCINMAGLIKVRTTREFGESTVSKILDLVENASSRKSKSENFISKFARIYTPAVCLSALALALLPPIVSLIIGADAKFSTWIYRALSFLVISCPCALVISIPLTFFAGIGGASRSGILIKGSNYMETLSKVGCVVFDKTGTVTKGVFEVTDICPSGIEKDELIELAAYAESFSNHPISISLRSAYEHEIDKSRISDVKEIIGKGVIAVVDGKRVAAGNRKLMDSLSVMSAAPNAAGTIVHVALNEKYCGYILISDVVKPHAAEAINELGRAGISHLVMLTGDTENTAASVTAILGIKEYYSDLLPADKVNIVETLLSKYGRNEKLAFVGDGINDAPVLTRADIGIAMGALGSDAAIEAADIVLMDDDPQKISKAIKISRKCLRIVYENIWFAIGVKLLCLLLSALGLVNMWAAIFADVGVMVIAVLNAVRALNIKKI